MSGVTEVIPDTGFIRSKDGTQLHYARFTNPDAGALLLFVHGFGEHCGRYDHVNRWFLERGYECAAFDYRGHGRSQGRRAYVDRFRQYLDDLDAFVNAMMARSDDSSRKVYLVGHSFGGLLVASYVLEQPEGIDGIVLSSPGFGFKVKVSAAKAALAKVMSTVYPTLELPTGIPVEDLSTDPSVGKAYEADPLVNKVATARWYTEALAQQQVILRHADRIQLPVLLLQAGEDRLVDGYVSQNFLAAVGSADKELKWYDGMYHEIFNEVRRDEVLDDMQTWLTQHG